MLSKEEMKKKMKELDAEIDIKIKEKMELQNNYFKMYKLDAIKKKYLNRYFVYRDNCYSCPSQKSDYWNVYYKVVEVNDNGAIIAVTLQRDKYGKIESTIQTVGVDYLNLEEIAEKEYIKETSKILGVLLERFKEAEDE